MSDNSIERLDGNQRKPETQAPADHDGHETIVATGRHTIGATVAFRRCLDCAVTASPVALCPSPTKSGASCRGTVRTDLGYTTCWSHGEGAGRTSTPRRRTA